MRHDSGCQCIACRNDRERREVKAKQRRGLNTGGTARKKCMDCGRSFVSPRGKLCHACRVKILKEAC